MRIAIGGMQKNEMEQEILKCCPDAQTIITNGRLLHRSM